MEPRGFRVGWGTKCWDWHRNMKFINSGDCFAKAKCWFSLDGSPSWHTVACQGSRDFRRTLIVLFYLMQTFSSSLVGGSAANRSGRLGEMVGLGLQHQGGGRGHRRGHLPVCGCLCGAVRRPEAPPGPALLRILWFVCRSTGASHLLIVVLWKVNNATALRGFHSSVNGSCEAATQWNVMFSWFLIWCKLP